MKKKIVQLKKLALNKETIAALSHASKKGIYGGAVTSPLQCPTQIPQCYTAFYTNCGACPPESQGCPSLVTCPIVC